VSQAPRQDCQHAQLHPSAFKVASTKFTHFHLTIWSSAPNPSPTTTAFANITPWIGTEPVIRLMQNACGLAGERQ